eukprot:scaffold35460_cov62-Phaeocystis_antarctica.AAC.1
MSTAGQTLANPTQTSWLPWHARTVGRVLVHLAMLSTASGWMLPPNGEADAFSSHATMITGGVSGARDRRRLVGSSCDGSWCASPRPCLCFPCASLPRLLRNTAAAVLAAVIFVMAALAAATRAATPTAMTAVTVVAMVFSAVTVIIATTVATAPATATAMTAATPIVTVDVTASAIPAVPPALLASTAPRASHLWPARRGSAAKHAPHASTPCTGLHPSHTRAAGNVLVCNSDGLVTSGCSTCTNKPANSAYTGGSTTNTCPYVCNGGSYRSGSSCQACWRREQ